MLTGLILTSAYAFTTGMPASLVIGHKSFSWGAPALNQTGFDWPNDLSFDSSGNLWVPDTSNHRVLMFKPPFSNDMAASLVIGQTDFNHNYWATSQTGLRDPTSVGFDSSGNLWVADDVNNRVLMFKPPFATHMAASLVIGQADFTHGGHTASQTGLYYPYSPVFDAAGNLWVSDWYNSRVLMFKLPFSNGMAASLVIGQPDFTTSTYTTTQTGLSYPEGLRFDTAGNLWATEDGNNRTLMFKPPFSNGMAASLVIGQTDFNSGGSATTQTGLNEPQGLGFDVVGNLWVADAGNNRILMFPGSTGLTGFLLELQTGWNLISLPIIPSQTAITVLLKPLIQLNDLKIVWGYSATTKAWAFFTPPNTGTLKSMVDGQAYWLNMREAVNITIAGYVIPPGAVPSTYSLTTGWNLVGFKPQPTVRNETVSLYLASVSSKCSLVWVYDNLNQTWLRGTSDLELAPGEGMWLYMTQPATLLPQ